MRIGLFFDTYLRRWTMSGQQYHAVGQRVNLLADGMGQLIERASREVGATDTAREDGIADERLVGLGEYKHDVARAMAGNMAHFDRFVELREFVALRHPLVDVNALEAELLAHEPLHNFWSLDERAIGSMRQDLSLSFADNLRATLRVVPVSMSNP